ncbi:MAG: hypothetical protein US49_C0001G0140 [candidate division TM6 bacterium GW2011_GWF2_37_49]|nr:MAG: hypothetical protein US49_C0001G0140 [candidate division TM6 bacterium GW2011_GWF2_37_49]
MKLSIKLFCRICVLFVLQVFAVINAEPLTDSLVRLKSHLRSAAASIQNIQAKLQTVQSSLAKSSAKISPEESDRDITHTYHGTPEVWTSEYLIKNLKQTPDQCNKIANAMLGAAIGSIRVKAPAKKDLISVPKFQGLSFYAYNGDIVLSHIVFEVLSQYHQLPNEAINTIARRFVNIFDSAVAQTIDPLWNLRGHSGTAVNACARIRSLVKQGKPWQERLRDPLVLTDEHGSGSLTRAFVVGLFYSNDIQKAIIAAEQQSIITHRKPIALASCAAIAAGAAMLCTGGTPEQVADAMIKAAGSYDGSEISFNKHETCKIKLQNVSFIDIVSIQELIAANKMLTSDMLRYAKDAATTTASRGAIDPMFVLRAKEADNNGYLNGWKANSAAAAVLYIFMRYCKTNTLDNFNAAMNEALSIYNPADAVPILVGAFLGYRLSGNLFDLPGAMNVEWADRMIQLRSNGQTQPIPLPEGATDLDAIKLTHATTINYQLKSKITVPAPHSVDLALKTTYHGSDEVDKVWSHAKLLANCGKSKEECNRFANAVGGAAIGDALGRVPETYSPSDLIKYGITKNSAPTAASTGIRWFDDIDKAKIELFNDNKPTTSFLYSDDTVMAHIVFEVLSEYPNPNEAIAVMAERFANLFDPDDSLYRTIDPLFSERIHGGTAPQVTKLVRALRSQNKPWTDNIKIEPQNTWNEFGCGSVMRVFPVGFFYSSDLEAALYVADAQSQITHRDLVARASCAAFTAGFVLLCNNPQADPNKVADAMINAAALYDMDEIKTAKLVKFEFNEANIAQQITDIKNHIKAVQPNFPGGKMLTSDMLRYAKLAAIAGINAETVLGKSSDGRTGSGRTTDGTLLGWKADEAVSAALYIFMLHPGTDFDNFTAAMQKSLNTVGDSDSIATLVGALLGYRFEGNIFDLPRVSEIEWYKQMRALRAN